MNHAVVSERAQGIPVSPIRNLYALADAAKHRGMRVFHLNIGQPAVPTSQDYFQEARRLVKSSIEYAPSAGMRNAVRAWQRYYQAYGIRLNKQDIIVTTGGSEALLFALIAVANPGDEILVFEPLYANYISLAQMVGVKLKPIRLLPQQRYQVPSSELIDAHITRKTKAVIVNNPGNPTGTVFSRKSLLRIANVARRRGIFIIADEVYREIIFNGTRHISMMDFSAVQDCVILVDSVSKRFNLCGARVGCIASKNRSIMEVVLRCAQGRLSAPSLEQQAVIPLLEHPHRHTRELVRQYERRRNIVIDSLEAIPGTSWAHPDGAFYIFVKLPVANAERFCRWLLQKYSYHGGTVMLAPGDGFYVTPGLGKQEVRIAYVLRDAHLRRAMNIVKRALAEYPYTLTI